MNFSHSYYKEKCTLNSFASKRMQMCAESLGQACQCYSFDILRGPEFASKHRFPSEHLPVCFMYWSNKVNLHFKLLASINQETQYEVCFMKCQILFISFKSATTTVYIALKTIGHMDALFPPQQGLLHQIKARVYDFYDTRDYQSFFMAPWWLRA